MVLVRGGGEGGGCRAGSCARRMLRLVLSYGFRGFARNVWRMEMLRRALMVALKGRNIPAQGCVPPPPCSARAPCRQPDCHRKNYTQKLRV